ncbi:MAG: FHA domain-containing protein, partial [Myxococcales bacterium]|nr:FHA domain-containing protein [Myxococcales bacterium]
MTEGILLSIQLPDGSTEQLSLEENWPVVIGRDPSCHVVLPSPEVSRRHLVVERRPNGFKYSDHSANGTLVGDHLVRQTGVRAPGGVPLKLGPYIVRVFDRNQPQPALPGPVAVHAT